MCWLPHTINIGLCLCGIRELASITYCEPRTWPLTVSGVCVCRLSCIQSWKSMYRFINLKCFTPLPCPGRSGHPINKINLRSINERQTIMIMSSAARVTRKARNINWHMRTGRWWFQAGFHSNVIMIWWYSRSRDMEDLLVSVFNLKFCEES